MCGISQDPQTNHYIMVYQDGYCENCYKEYTNASMEWCEPCQIKYFTKKFTEWTSGNEQIDNYIREMQLKKLKINPRDAVFEWVPYDQFENIKEIGKDGIDKIYSAIWKDGSLYWDIDDDDEKEWTRRLDEIVTLKYLKSNSQNIIDEFLNKV